MPPNLFDLSAWMQVFENLMRLVGLNPTITPQVSMFSVFFGGGFSCSAIVMLLIAAVQSLQAMSSRAWPTAHGVVLSSEVGAFRDSDGTSYRPLIKYQYQVGETAYIGDRLAFGSRGYSAGHGAATRKVQQYPAGSSVRVRYKPNQPKESVLETRSAAGCLLFGMGALFLCIGIGGAIMGLYFPTG